MTRPRTLKTKSPVLNAFLLSIAVLTILIAFAAPAQQAGTGQSAKPSVVFVPPDASTSAQAPNPAQLGADGGPERRRQA